MRHTEWRQPDEHQPCFRRSDVCYRWWGNGHSTIQLVPVRGGGGSGGGYRAEDRQVIHLAAVAVSTRGGGTSIGGFGVSPLCSDLFRSFRFHHCRCDKKEQEQRHIGHIHRKQQRFEHCCEVRPKRPCGNVAVPDSLVEEYVALKAKDPAFTMSAFDDLARRVFYAVQTAWCDRQPGGTRKVMADKIWQNAHPTNQHIHVGGTRNRLDGLAIQYNNGKNITTR